MPRLTIAVKIVPHKLGSMEAWLVGMCVAARQLSWKVQVLTYAPVHEQVLRQIEQSGAEWVDLSEVERSIVGAAKWFAANADVVHLSLFAPRDTVVVASQLSKRRSVVFQDCFSSPAGETNRRLLTSILDKVTFRKSTEVVGVSEFVSNRTGERFGVPKDKLSTIYNGVDCRRFAGGKAPSACTGVLCVAALIDDKGVDVLLRAFASESLQGSTLDVVGDGPKRRELEALADSLGIASQVRFLGMRDDVHLLLQEAAILVHPAIWGEAFGLTVAEGMASGRAVVASKVGAIPEIVEDGESGKLVAPGSVEDLARAIASLVLDPAERDRLGSAARKRACSMFTVESWIAGHIEKIEAVAINGARS